MPVTTTIRGSVQQEGSWTSQLLDVSIGSFVSADFNGFFGIFSFRYEGGDANSSVKVDILNSSGAILLSDITLTDSGRFKTADLSVLPTVRNTDIRIRIRLRAETKSPVVSDMEILWSDVASS